MLIQTLLVAEDEDTARIRIIKDYLPSLQTQQKWQRDNINLAVPDVVMVIDPQLPRGLWPIGKVNSP